MDELSGMEGGPWRGGFHGARDRKEKKKERKRSGGLREGGGAAGVVDICMKSSSLQGHGEGEDATVAIVGLSHLAG